MEEFNLDLIEQSFQRYKVGMVVPATVVGKRSDGVVVAIGGKSDGLISGEEAEEYKNLGKGAKLDVMIQSTKTVDGCIAVSAKKAVDVVEKNLQIPEIRKGVKFTAIVDSSSKAGLNCFFGAWRVFVPASEVEEFYVRDLEKYKGKEIELVATDFDDEKRQIVASRRAHVVADKSASQELFWHGIFVNKLVVGKVVRITNFGAFVEVGGVDCLVHNTEVSYDRGKSAKDIFRVGQEYQFRVTSVDREAGKVQLSHKATATHPFDAVIDQVAEGEKYAVTIKKLLPYGVIARLENGLEGMIHISELSNSYVQSITEVCNVGDKKEAIIIHIDKEARKISLSLRTEIYEEEGHENGQK